MVELQNFVLYFLPVASKTQSPLVLGKLGCNNLSFLMFSLFIVTIFRLMQGLGYHGTEHTHAFLTWYDSVMLIGTHVLPNTKPKFP